MTSLENGFRPASDDADDADDAKNTGGINSSADRWRTPTIASAQLGLLAAGLAVCVAVRRFATADTTSDEVALVLVVTTAFFLLLLSAAATRHALHRKGANRVLRSVMPVGALLLFAGFLHASFVDVSVGLATLMASTQPDTPPVLFVGSNGGDIRLAGDLTEGTARRLKVLLDNHPGVVRIHLTSDGGLANEGQEVGEVIAAHHLATFVPDYCVSACTLAFVRGRERLVLPDAKLGFHAPYQEGLGGSLYRGDGDEQRAAYLAAGLTANFVTAALKVDPSDIWTPTVAELRAAHVITAVVDRDALPDSGLDDNATPAGARSAILRNFPILATLAEHSPRAIDLIAAWYLDAYREGRSEGENVDVLQSVVSGSVALMLARADDPTLLAVARYFATAIDATKDAASCATIGGDLDVVEAAAQVGRSGDAALLVQRAILGRHSLGDSIETARVWREPDGEDMSCASWRKVWSTLLTLPPQRAVAIIRGRLLTVAARDLRKHDRT